MLRVISAVVRFFSFSESGLHWVPRPNVPAFAQAQDAEAFARHTQLYLAFLGRICAALCVLVALLWWPVDWLIYLQSIKHHGPPQQFRIALCMICALYLLSSRSPLFARNGIWGITATMTAIMATLGATAGSQGGLEQPWYHLCYPLQCASLLFPAPLRQRFIMVSVLAMGSLGGLLLPHPEHGQSPFLPLTLSMLFLTTLASTALGHYNYLIFRDNFRQAQELARNAAELEARVAEKTQDMRELLAHSENLLDKERARIARDLHDELGQELTAVRFAVALTQERFAQAPQSIEKNLLEIDHIVQRTSKTVRGLVSELRPLLLDDLGLHAAAQWLTSRITQRTGLDCQLKIIGDSQELPPEVVTAAYRLMQEALTNVARHAQATQVQVTLHTRREQLDLRITDDGIGFDPALRSPGMGLLGMRERALALGTKLIIRSAPEAGTEIQCSLPLTAKGVVKFSSQPVVVESQT